jgi:DNA-binding transcriptional LysR family regulator
LVLAAAPTPLADFETVTFDKPWSLTTSSNQAGDHAFLNQAANHLNKPLKIRIQVGNFEALCRMVESNIGIGVLPESSARRYAKAMTIRIVQLVTSGQCAI